MANSNDLRQEFIEYARNCILSRRPSSKSDFIIGQTAADSYVSFVEVDKLFSYNPEKWKDIRSIFDIDSSERIKEIYLELVGDDEFNKVDSQQASQYFRSNAIKLYYNQHFNKTLSHLQSIKDQQGIKRSTRRIIRMYDKRDRYFEDAFQKVSRQIVDMLVEKKIGRLIVGYNAGWKQESDMGKRNNQKFVQMPFARLASYLRYKCEMVGIDFVEHEESYTSKCDALALEPIGKHEQYLGRRTKRGLFRSSIGKLINADHNGALNIMRKVVGDSYVSRIVNSGHSLCPVRYSNSFVRIV